MASSRLAAGAEGLPQRQNSVRISSLPPELLVAAFQHVPLAERQSSLALVCRQWAELVHSPALLASLEVTIEASPERLLQRLRSLVEWLARRAVGHVQQLRLKAGVPEDEDANEWQDFEAAALLVSAPTLLAGSLREVSLSTQRVLLPPPSSWLAPLAGLTSLELASTGANLMFAAPLRCLTALRRLRITALEVQVFVEPEASLPPGLTHLWLCGFEGGLPPQVGALRHLQELTLEGMSGEQDGYGPLAELHPTLTALNLTNPTHMPDCLSRLTALRSLTIHDGNKKLAEQDKQVLMGALPRLQQLTAVHVVSDGLQDSHAALASLPRLEAVCWRGRRYSWEYALEQALPGGSWLSRLRRLVMPAPTLAEAASLEALSEARQLEQLGVSCTTWVRTFGTRGGPRKPAQFFSKETYRNADVLRILEWAVRHSSLQRVVVQRMSADMVTAAGKAQQQRPGLRVVEDEDVYGAVCGFQLPADA